MCEGRRHAVRSALAVPALTGQHAHSACALPPQRRDSYARRRPEETALYQCVAEHWPEFRERMEEQGGLPKFVEQEFEAYLGCGRLEAGCLELQCRSCGHSLLVALSCKRRGFCAACLARRMSDTAVHLEQEVLPEVPVRHWVCTFPWGVRAVLGYDRELCRAAASAFAQELSRSLKRRAKTRLACYQAAASGVAVSAERAGQPDLRLLAGGAAESEHPHDDPRAAEPLAEALGVNLYAKQLVDGRDRKQLERLCRYVMRPPLSQERLEWRPDGSLELTLKNVWKDGTRALVLEPFDLLVRLCSAIPPPWFNMVKYFGVLSSHSRHRARVVPKRIDPLRFAPPAAAGDQLELGFSSGSGAATVPVSRRSRWGWLLGHVFRADLDTCSRCGGPMRWVEAATAKADIQRLLAKHGLAPQPPPERRAPVKLGQLLLPFG